MDVSILRVILVLLLFLTSGTLGWIYLAWMLFVPQANTTIQKLQMYGEPITVENIGRKMNEENLNQTQYNAKFQKSFLDKCVYVIGVILRACIIGLLILFIPVWLVLAVCLLLMLVILIIAPFMGSVPAFDPLNGELIELTNTWLLSSFFGVLLVTAIPLGLLIYFGCQRMFNWKPIATNWKWVLLVLWIIGIVNLGVSLPLSMA